VDEKVVYAGRDLEAMSFAVNYHRWILQSFKPYLGTRLVEVGAGTGSFAELLLLEHTAESLSLVEPSEAMYEIMNKRVESLSSQSHKTQVQTYNTTFRGVADHLKVTQQPNSVIYVNVLEHILDDRNELALVHHTIGKGGRILIFVPALRWLYGNYDEHIGHHRRYTKADLESKCREAGFQILECKYFDMVGIVPWWVKYRLLKSREIEAQAIKFYDKYVVPASRVVEAKMRPLIGKNLVLIAEKP